MENDPEQEAKVAEEDQSPESLPAPPSLPQTKVPLQINNQFNVQQIPNTAWDRLSPEQVVDLSKAILNNIDSLDERHFKFAMDQAERTDRGKTLAVKLGTLIAVAGYLLTAYLAWNGNEVAAVAVGSMISTVLAVVVGKRFLD